MGLSARVAGPISKVLARLHRWYATAWVLGHVPITHLSDLTIGRLRYALMMSNRSHPTRTQSLLHGIIRLSRDVTPELRIELAAMATAIHLPQLATDLLTQVQQQATRPETTDASEKLLWLNRADAHGSLQPMLHDKIDTLALEGSGMLTLVPVSGKYLELWDLWLQQVRIHACRQVVAMAMDDAAYMALSGMADVAVVDLREFFSLDSAGRLHPHTRGVLWYLRVLLLRDLVQRGYPVLVLDLDAIPVGDVHALLSGMTDADVIAQRDHSIPMDVDRQLGFVLCCGFMLWRKTPATLSLLDRFVEEAALERDDQCALNHLLARRGIRKSADETAGLWFNSMDVRLACPAEVLVSRSLESGSVVRHFHQTGKSVADIRNALNL